MPLGSYNFPHEVLMTPECPHCGSPQKTVCDPPGGYSEEQAKKLGYPCRYWYECEKCKKLAEDALPTYK